MNIEFVFRNLETTDALKEHLTKKAEKLQKVFPFPMDTHFALSVSKAQHIVEITCSTKKRRFVSTAATADLYESIDMAVHKLEAQLKKARDVHKGHKSAHQSARPHSQKLGRDVQAETPHKDKRAANSEMQGEAEVELESETESENESES